MSFPATVYRVLIASPGDLEEERGTIEDVVHSWNSSHAVAERVVLLPVRWETHSVPEYGDRPQAIVNRRVAADCDILIGAFWTRLGTPTGDFESGTVEEIERFGRAGKPVLLYFSSRPVDPNQVDLDQFRRVREFRARIEQLALVHQFSSPADLHIKLTRHLQEQARRLTAVGGGRSPTGPSTGGPQPQSEIPRVREVHFGRYTVRVVESGTIEVERDGRPVKPTKPALRELASELNVELRNSNGDQLTTRQLGTRIMKVVERLGAGDAK